MTKSTVFRVFVGVGSNLGEREKYIAAARAALTTEPGIISLKSSRLYETEPVGGPVGQGNYLNAVWEIETSLTPLELLDIFRELETRAGRDRRSEVKWGPRTLDLDMLLYGDRVFSSERLTIPHPRMTERRFVLEPLAELAADVIHPVLLVPISDVLKRLHEPLFIS